MQDAGNQTYYRNRIDHYRIMSDALFGITTERVEDNTWLRDATAAYDIPDVLPEVLDAYNALLRCISRARAVSYAMAAQGIDGSEIQEATKKLEAEMLEKNANIRLLEKNFDTLLVKNLYEAHLTEGCTSKADAEKLLFYYRTLSSVLDPAMTLVTVTYDKETGMLQREVQKPITKKTQAQKDAIERTLKHIDILPNEKTQNAHTHHKQAMQKADKIFADLIVQDDRMLSDEARKTHAVGGGCNTFLVTVETEFDVKRIPKDLNQPLNDTKPLRFVRAGMPVYVGEGECKEEIQAYTQQNIQQICTACDVDAAHYLALNTDMPHSFPGATTLRMLGQKAIRLEIAAEVLLKAAETEKISIVTCEGGQDTTGAISEYAIEKAALAKWKEKYQQQHNALPSQVEEQAQFKCIQLSRVKAFNAAEVASFMTPGSPGLKYVSKANDLMGGKRIFSEAAERMLYRASADTRTQNKVHREVAETLKVSSERAEQAFTNALKGLARVSAPGDNDSPVLQMVKDAGLRLHHAFKPEVAPVIDEQEEDEDFEHAVMRRVKTLKHDVSERLLTGKKAVFGVAGMYSAEDIEYMIEAVLCSTRAIEEFKAENPDYSKLNLDIKRMKAVTAKLPGHRSVAYKIAALCLVMVLAACIVAVIAFQPLAALAVAAAGALSILLMTSAFGAMNFGVKSALSGAKALFTRGLEGEQAGAMREFKSMVKQAVKLQKSEHPPEAEPSNEQDAPKKSH